MRFYQDNGYIQLLNVLLPGELETVRQWLAEAMTKPAEKSTDMSGNLDVAKVFLQKVNLWRDHEGMRQYVLGKRIAGIARRLAGTTRVRLWHDHALIKRPRDSKPSPWHQDLPYWPMNQAGALSCWMALDDVNKDNGCMEFIPGSHTWGKLDPINLVDPQDIFKMVPDKDPAAFKPVAMPMPAGSCTFHHGLTFHYAYHNVTDKPRRAIITIYMPEGISYRHAPHVVTDSLGLRENDPISGELFPVLSEG